MNVRLLKPLTVTLLLSGLIAMPSLADTSTAHKKSLEASVATLEKEVASLKSQMRTDNQVKAKLGKILVARKNIQKAGDPSADPAPDPAGDPSADPASNDSQNSSQLSGQSLLKLVSESQTYLPFDLDVPGRAFVSTGPYVGVPIQFAGTNLIINSPSVNTDVQLLQIRKSIINQLEALGPQLKTPAHSHLLLSGIIEAQGNYTNHGGSPSTTDIDVTNVSLDLTVFGPSDWLLGFIEFTYDNSEPISSGVFESTSHFRVGNSRLVVNKAFITIGDFACSPFYGSVGQYYVPFGTYSSVMVSDTLPKLLARTKARALLAGFQQQTPNALYGAVYIFRGDSHAASVAKVNNGGINVGFKFDAGTIKGNIGGGVIANLADSGGMQLGTGFQDHEQLIHRVPAYNARGTLSLGSHIDLIGEFITASTHFNPNDMAFNGSGAKPWAFDLEAAYSFPILDDKPSSIGIGYAKTKEALAIGIPLTRTSIVFNTSLLRNTLQSLEFRHDREYAASNTASGAGAVSSQQTGKADNAITAQFDYYF